MTRRMSTTFAFKRGDQPWVTVLWPVPNPMEDAMTATAAATERAMRPGPTLSAVPDVAEPTGWFARFRGWVSRMWGKITSYPRRGWNRLRNAGPVRWVIDKAAIGWRWSRAKATAAYTAAGWSGMTGLGLVILATESGRGMIRRLFWPVRYCFGQLDRGWVWAAGKIGTWGSAGEWTANRMMDLEEFFAGNSSKPGIIGRAVDFYEAQVAPWIATNTVAMAVARAVGALLLVFRAPAVIGLLGTGMVTTVCVWVGTTALGIVATMLAVTAAVRLFDLAQAAFQDLEEGQDRRAGLWMAYSEPMTRSSEPDAGEPAATATVPVAAVPDTGNGASPKPSGANRAERRGTPAAQPSKRASRARAR